MRIIVLGAGLVGGPMARDLAADGEFEVTVADRDAEALGPLAGDGLATVPGADFADPAAVRRLVRDFDLVLGAEPSHLGRRVLEAVIDAGRPLVDIAFGAENPLDLDERARRRGVTAVVDCGVHPGLGSMLVGEAQRRLGRLDAVRILVGGLPVERRPPFEYVTVFSPRDVLEEYTRPARRREGGRLVVAPALSDPELVEIPGVGALEAFNTDGLRTLLTTIDAPDLCEKTLRYPGHAARMALLRDAGFLDGDPVTVDGAPVRPVDLTAALLFPRWRRRPDEAEFTALRVEIDGRAEGRPVRWIHDLLDRTDPRTGTTSMARTTGYTATMVVRALAAGRYARPGVSPPEHLGREPGCVAFVREGLARRGVVVRDTRSGGAEVE